MIDFQLDGMLGFTQGGRKLSEELDVTRPRVAAAVERLARGGEMLGWAGLPLDEKTAVEIAVWVSSLPRSVTSAVVLGIGGSSLGPKALYTACHYPMPLLDGWRPDGARRLYFLDNSDPETVAAVLGHLDIASTLFIVVTKSGATAETASQLMIAWERARAALGERAAGSFVFVTDPEKGDLRALARELKVRAFPLPPDVGGRFSVLSPVGLLPAAVAGISPVALLRGAAAMRARCLDTAVERNPAALLGAGAYLLDTVFGRKVHVLMPYADRLADVGAWFVQLWAESLGKRRGNAGVGPTPVDARGATDQHSVLQLFKEGPPDKFVMFVDVRARRALEIPAVFGAYDSFAYLGGHEVGELIRSERIGTQRSLALAGTPTVTIELEEVTPGRVAALLYLLEAATAIAGFLYGVNPFDQPGVEESKRFTCALMGRPGYERYREAAGAGAPAGGPTIRVDC